MFPLLLILKDPNATQWTNTTLCGVTGYPSYNNRIPIVVDTSIQLFAKYMNAISSSLVFDFDHAVAIIPPLYLFIYIKK